MCPGYKPIGKATVPINLTAVSSLQIHVFVHYNILLVGVAYMYVEGIQYLRHLPSSPFGSLSFCFHVEHPSSQWYTWHTWYTRSTWYTWLIHVVYTLSVVHLIHLIHLIHLVHLIHLIHLIHLMHVVTVIHLIYLIHVVTVIHLIHLIHVVYPLRQLAVCSLV